MAHKSSFLLSSLFLFFSLLVIVAHARSFFSIIQNGSPRRTLQGNSDVLLAEQINTQPFRYACLDQSGVATSRKYQSNIKSLISSLSSDASTSNGFGNTTAGSAEDKVYGLFVCRGDVNSSLCHSCVQQSGRLIQQHCPNNATAVLWNSFFCVLRYSNQDFFGNLTLRPHIHVLDASQNFTSAGEFDGDARILMNGLIQIVSEKNLMFGTHVFNINGTQERYGWVQCSRDISSEDCKTCLSSLLKDVENCCEGKRVWRIICPSCIIMYETQPFFINDTALIVPTHQPAGRKSNNKTMLVVIIFTTTVVVLAGLVFCIIYFRFLRKKTIQENGQNPIFSEDQTDEENATSADLPMMSLKTILQSTCNFSDEHKLGQGGFGSVYKGVLPDGKEIAVKRLSTTSGQGSKEFMNEVILIAKLQHRNLVRLLACCVEQNEKLLVYEYMPNSSLDFYLFNKENRSKLEWKVRLSIINGIAKGLLYLHEDSRLRVVHRDLKASNILLDHEMNPKISDFGLARAFRGNQKQANTVRVVGTYGYMAPEYAMEGLFSTKSDVFSFGVLLLEIISGKKNGGFYLSEHGRSLLIYAWRLWCEGKGLDLIDPILERSSFEALEVLKCIHIGLLCVQEDEADRPTMSSVVYELASDSVNLPRPTQPAFSVGRAFLEKGSSSNIADNHDSVNELTISEIEAR